MTGGPTPTPTPTQTRERLILHELMHEFAAALDGNTELAAHILKQCVERVDAVLAERGDKS